MSFDIFKRLLIIVKFYKTTGKGGSSILRQKKRVNSSRDIIITHLSPLDVVFEVFSFRFECFQIGLLFVSGFLFRRGLLFFKVPVNRVFRQSEFFIQDWQIPEESTTNSF